MTKFYRVSDEKMKALEVYMNPDIREEVHNRYAPCTNEEFLAQVFLRRGINEEVIKDLLNIDISVLEHTFIVIDLIRNYMGITNRINYARLKDPEKDYLKSNDIEAVEYRQYLQEFADCVDKMLELIPDKEPGLMGLKENFPEIGYTYINGYIIYKWNGEVI